MFLGKTAEITLACLPMETGSDLITTNKDDFEDFYMNATVTNKGSPMVGNGIDLSTKGSAKANDSIVLNKQLVNKPFELLAKVIPNPEINLYDCISQFDLLVFVETCENA